MMHSVPDPVDAILASCGMDGPWEPLPATGIANRIYATREAVLRVATDHPEAVCDARTESVAAPVAHAAGVLTPRLLPFDDEPGRNPDLDALLARLLSIGRIDRATASEAGALIEELRPALGNTTTTCFLHNDRHDMNVMCTDNGSLLALIDWGDAGWGDPTIEFAQIPLPAIPHVVLGYEEAAPGLLGSCPEARVIWDKLDYAMEELADNPSKVLPLDAYRAFLDSSG